MSYVRSAIVRRYRRAEYREWRSDFTSKIHGAKIECPYVHVAHKTCNSVYTRDHKFADCTVYCINCY